MSALAFLAASTLLAAPKPEPLPSLPAPLGQVGTVVQPAGAKAPTDQDRAVLSHVAGCEDQAIFPLRMLASTIRAAEQLDGWLASVKGLEAKVFGKAKGTLGGVVAHLRTAAFEAKHECGEAPVRDGFKLVAVAPPAKWCPLPEGAGGGTRWFFSAGKPAAVVFVDPGAAPACRARVSALLFDAKGKPRLAVHADWGGAMAAELFGDRACVDFAFDAQEQSFRPTLGKCAK